MSTGEIWRRLLFFRHRTRMARELQEEMRLHIALRAQKLREQGVADGDAFCAAEKQFGNKTLLGEVSREMWGGMSVERFLQDVRFAVRSLRRNLGFSAVTVATFALGIGVNTAIFSVVNAVLLRSLPYPKANEIVHMSLVWKSGDLNDTLTVPEFEFYRDHNTAFQAIAGFRDGSTVSIKHGETLQWITSARVTDGFFGVLGVQPAIGRGIEGHETRVGGPPVAILTDSLWRATFGADPSVIGRQIELDDVAYTVIGVLPAGFSFIEQPADIFVPLQLGRSIADTGMNTRVIARLKPGTSLAQAQANINLVFEHLRQAGLAQSGQRGIQLENYQKWLAGDFRTSILMLFGAVGLLLLIACANIASLFMARASARQREISVRFALGAGRWRLFQQFLAESFIIALLGGMAGLLAARWALKALIASIPWHNPLFARVGLDARVLSFTLLLAVATSLVFGFASCWQISALDVNRSLKESASHGWAGAGRNRARSILVIGEIAFSLMLSAGAGLLIQSIYFLHQQKLGFDSHDIYTMETPFGSATKLTPTQIWNFEQQALQRIQAIPGVVSAATVNKLPLTGPANLPTQHKGHPEHSIGGMEYRAISAQYFQTMHIAMLEGRPFRDSDTASSTPVAIISDSVARAWWGDKNPIGDRIVVGEYRGRQFPEVLEQRRQIVGVVADVKNLAINEHHPTTVYVPAPQLSRALNSTAWVIRATRNPSMGSALRAAVLSVRPDQRVLNLQSMSDLVAHSMARPSFNASLMSTFAALALALTSVGIYGLLSFQVARRTQEIGIRMALGANRASVRVLIVKQAAVLALVGIALGVVGGVIFTRFLSSLLSGIHATDPLTYFAVSMLPLGLALAASYAPARRASNVDPLVALRYE